MKLLDLPMMIGIMLISLEHDCQLAFLEISRQVEPEPLIRKTPLHSFSVISLSHQNRNQLFAVWLMRASRAPTCSRE
jgi:hypothetical protein